MSSFGAISEFIKESTRAVEDEIKVILRGAETVEGTLQKIGEAVIQAEEATIRFKQISGEMVKLEKEFAKGSDLFVKQIADSSVSLSREAIEDSLVKMYKEGGAELSTELENTASRRIFGGIEEASEQEILAAQRAAAVEMYSNQGRILFEDFNSLKSKIFDYEQVLISGARGSNVGVQVGSRIEKALEQLKASMKQTEEGLDKTAKSYEQTMVAVEKQASKQGIDLTGQILEPIDQGGIDMLTAEEETIKLARSLKRTVEEVERNIGMIKVSPDQRIIQVLKVENGAIRVGLQYVSKFKRAERLRSVWEYVKNKPIRTGLGIGAVAGTCYTFYLIGKGNTVYIKTKESNIKGEIDLQKDKPLSVRFRVNIKKEKTPDRLLITAQHSKGEATNITYSPIIGIPAGGKLPDDLSDRTIEYETISFQKRTARLAPKEPDQILLRSPYFPEIDKTKPGVDPSPLNLLTRLPMLIELTLTADCDCSIVTTSLLFDDKVTAESIGTATLAKEEAI